MSRTNRARAIERQENALALLSDLTHAAEVLGLLLDEPADQAALATIREQLQGLKARAIARRARPAVTRPRVAQHLTMAVVE